MGQVGLGSEAMLSPGWLQSQTKPSCENLSAASASAASTGLWGRWDACPQRCKQARSTEDELMVNLKNQQRDPTWWEEPHLSGPYPQSRGQLYHPPPDVRTAAKPPAASHSQTRETALLMSALWEPGVHVEEFQGVG